MEKVLSKIETYIAYAVIFLFPFFVLSISSNPYVVPKLAILSFGIALLLLIRIIRIISSGKLELSISNFDFPILLLAVTYLVSTILRTPNKMEGYLLPGTTTAVVGGVLLYFLLNQFKEREKDAIAKVLFLSAGVFSALTLLAFSGLFSKIPQLPAYLKAQSFTPEGGYLPSAIFLLALLPIGIGVILSEKNISKKALYIASTVVMVLGLGISVYNLIPGKPFSPRFPSYNVSWSIAIDALKESPILGIGPGNYLSAFNRYRPLSYNSTDLWAIKFATARSFYMTIMTEAGLLGLAAIILLLLNLYKLARKDIKEKMLVNWGFAGTANLISLIIIVLAFVFFPATVLLIVAFFILFSLIAKTHKTSLNLTTQSETEAQGTGIAALSTQKFASKFPALLITIPVFILLVLFAIRSTRILLGEYKFQKALNYLVANDAAKTYDTMRQAISYNPQVDRYHATFARINLALANAIATKKDITDQDRTNITTLVQQAISEGKSTVALNPFRAGNWEMLAQVYRAIMPLAQGADAFSVQTYNQAIALDPLNPNLRIALGGIYYSRKDYQTAARVFELATQAKRDHANAHYNLAFAYRELNQLDNAIQEMTLAMSLITDKTGQDYQVAKKALEDMQAKKKAQAPVEGQELTPPQGTSTTPSLKPPINLPEGSQPPEAPITPTPSPAAEISPTP